MKEALKIFEDNGLSVHQAHAPFNRYGQYGNMPENLAEDFINLTYKTAKHIWDFA